jgi:hypothetical protein
MEQASSVADPDPGREKSQIQGQGSGTNIPDLIYGNLVLVSRVENTYIL